MNDKFHEECGVFAVYGHPEASKMAYLGLYALQHRGQESSGIVSSYEGRLHRHASTGLVSNVYHEEDLEDKNGRFVLYKK